MKVASLAEQLFFTTAHISATDGTQSWVGTGFFHGVPTDGGNVDLLVTNKHVVDRATSITVRLITAGDEGPQLGEHMNITVDPFGPESWKGHPNPGVDVAVLPVRAALEAVSSAGRRVFYRSVPPGMMLDDATLDDLDALESVVFVGYPSGIFDTVNLTPVARQGMTATPIMVDYQGLPAFLIDASVFPGSSGSPVFIFDRGMRTTKQGQTLIGATRAVLLGVLAAVHVRTVDGRVTQVATALEVSFDEPVDLGMVFRASTVTTCVNDLLAEHRLARVEEARDVEPTEPDAEPSSAEERLADSATT